MPEVEILRVTSVRILRKKGVALLPFGMDGLCHPLGFRTDRFPLAIRFGQLGSGVEECWDCANEAQSAHAAQTGKPASFGSLLSAVAVGFRVMQLGAGERFS